MSKVFVKIQAASIYKALQMDIICMHKCIKSPGKKKKNYCKSNQILIYTIYFSSVGR